MIKIEDVLRGFNPYPVPKATLVAIALNRGIDLEQEATLQIVKSASFCLAKADLFVWLLKAPNVSQGGQNYSFGTEERKNLTREANRLYSVYGEADSISDKPTYGYKGSRL